MVFINGGFQIIQPSFSMFFGFSINQKPSSCWGTPIPDGWASAVAQSLDGSYSNIDYKIIQNLFPQIFHFDSMAIWDMVIMVPEHRTGVGDPQILRPHTIYVGYNERRHRTGDVVEGAIVGGYVPGIISGCVSKWSVPQPIGSVCMLYMVTNGNIDHQSTPNVSIYTIHGSVMGNR